MKVLNICVIIFLKERESLILLLVTVTMTILPPFTRETLENVPPRINFHHSWHFVPLVMKVDTRGNIFQSLPRRVVVLLQYLRYAAEFGAKIAFPGFLFQDFLLEF